MIYPLQNDAVCLLQMQIPGHHSRLTDSEPLGLRSHHVQLHQAPHVILTYPRVWGLPQGSAMALTQPPPTSWALTIQVTKIDPSSFEPTQKLKIEPGEDENSKTVCLHSSKVNSNWVSAKVTIFFLLCACTVAGFFL